MNARISYWNLVGPATGPDFRTVLRNDVSTQQVRTDAVYSNGFAWIVDTVPSILLFDLSPVWSFTPDTGVIVISVMLGSVAIPMARASIGSIVIMSSMIITNGSIPRGFVVLVFLEWIVAHTRSILVWPTILDFFYSTSVYLFVIPVEMTFAFFSSVIFNFPIELCPIAVPSHHCE